MNTQIIPDHTEELVKYFLGKLASKYDVPAGLYIPSERTIFPKESKSCFSPLCSYFANNKKLKLFCDKDHATRGKTETYPVVRMCHCGLLNFSYPIYLRDKHVGTILCGQKRVSENKQAQESLERFNLFIKNNSSIINQSKAKSNYEKVHIVKTGFFDTIKHDIQETAELIIKVFFERREIEEERELLQKNISFIAHEILIHNQGACAAASELVYNVRNNQNNELIDIALHLEGSMQHITTVVTNLVWSGTQMSYSFCEINIIDVLRDAISHYNWYASGRDIDIVFSLGHGSPKIFCSRNHILQVINNLLHNAIKYSFRGNTQDNRRRFVTVKYEKDYSMHAVCVEFVNYGVGFLEKEYEKLSKYQYRGSLVANENRSGTGLGLRIVSRIIDKHKGKIEVNSTKLPGKAYLNSFKIYLPINGQTGGLK